MLMIVNGKCWLTDYSFVLAQKIGMIKCIYKRIIHVGHDKCVQKICLKTRKEGMRPLGRPRQALVKEIIP
jgi:hypothetical protein